MNFPIQYEQPLYRPPAEAQSLLLPVTVGCSWNRCTFCAMYRSKKFRVRDADEILGDIRKASIYYSKASAPRKAFLSDGDALAAPTETLRLVLQSLRVNFPALRRVALYASVRNVLGKSDSELASLAELGLQLAYLGIESGSDQVLALINKGSRYSEACVACARLSRAGIKASQIYMLGLGGRELSEEHCRLSAKLISETSPQFLSFLTTTAVPDTSYAKALTDGEFHRLSSRELLIEMRAIIGAVAAGSKKIILRANHVSNLFPVEGVLPRDSKLLLHTLSQWIEESDADSYPDLDPAYL